MRRARQSLRAETCVVRPAYRAGLARDCFRYWKELTDQARGGRIETLLLLRMPRLNRQFLIGNRSNRTADRRAEHRPDASHAQTRRPRAPLPRHLQPPAVRCPAASRPRPLRLPRSSRRSPRPPVRSPPRPIETPLPRSPAGSAPIGGFTLRSSDSEIRSSGSEIRSLKSEIRSLTFDLRCLNLQLRCSKSEIRYSDSQRRRSEFEIRNSETQLQRPKFER